MKIRRYAITLLMALALFGCPPMRPKPVTLPQVINAEGTVTHAASGMTFPMSVGDFRRNKVIRYDAESLNVSAGYVLGTVTEAVLATVYVYPAPWLVSGGSPANVVADCDQLPQGAFEAEKRAVMNYRPGVILIQESDASLLQNKALHSGKMATLDFEEVFAGHRQLVRSHLYVFCCGKWVVKYRFTHSLLFNAKKEIDEFMRNLSWTFR